MSVPRKLLYVILIFAVIAAASFTLDYFNVKFEMPGFEELTPPRTGFYRGFTGDGVLFFATYSHPNFGEIPLVQYSTLHSNKFNLYAFSFSTKDITLEVVTYLVRIENRTVREGNTTRTETVEIPYDQRIVKVPVHVIANSFSKVEVELPTSLEERQAEIQLNGRTLFKFKHETWKAYVPAPKFTLGTLFLDRLAYMAATTLVVFVAIAFSKLAVRHLKAIPEFPRWALAILPTVFLILGGFGVFFIIYYYALLEASYILAIIFVVALVYGVFINRPKPDSLLLLKFPVAVKDINIEEIENNPEMAEQVIFKITSGIEPMLMEIVEDEKGVFMVPSWLGLLRRIRTPVKFIGNHGSIIENKDLGITVALCTDVQESDGEEKIFLAGPEVHGKLAYMAGLLSTEQLNKALEVVIQKLYEMKANKDKEVLERAIDLSSIWAEQILEPLGLAPKKEEKETEKSEQAGESES